VPTLPSRTPGTTGWAYLQLLRPANVATAAADVLAGYAAAGAVASSAAGGAALAWLVAAGCSLYAGGVVLNDVFDRDVDAIERPERPIPSGRVRARAAALLGASLLIAGVLAASQVTRTATVIAVAIAFCCVAYDAWSKRHGLAGSVNMGLCRGLNLLLGVAIVPAALAIRWPLALFAIAYIAAVTAISRGEVHGGSRVVARTSLTIIVTVIVGLALLSLGTGVNANRSAIAALLFTLVLAWQVLPAFWRAARDPRPAWIRNAVRTGVLSLVLLNAVIATTYGGALWGLLVLATAVAARALARPFAVT
jgi:4-hydroxybenzoate polyprenyltransferase